MNGVKIEPLCFVALEVMVDELNYLDHYFLEFKS